MTLDWDEVRRGRLVKNEQTFRDYNNRRVAFEEETARARRAGAVRLRVRRLASASRPLELTVDDYTSAHSAPNLFTVKPGHVYPEVERVVETTDRFWVVEKHVVDAKI